MVLFQARMMWVIVWSALPFTQPRRSHRPQLLRRDGNACLPAEDLHEHPDPPFRRDVLDRRAVKAQTNP
jgi:hypothetical protein